MNNIRIVRDPDKDFEIAAQYDLYAHLPLEWKWGEKLEDGWGNPSPKNPLTVYVIVTGHESGEESILALEFDEVVDDFLNGFKGMDKTMEYVRPLITELRDSLKGLVTKLDLELAKPIRSDDD
jgi:hypothetical protein